MLPLDQFFSLDMFAHRSLWKEGEPIWSPLLLLKDYLRQNNPSRIEIALPEGIFLEWPELISIGEGTIIEPGVYIQGPCIIGKNCTIRHGAYLRGPIICGDHCQIGHSAELKHSILLDHACATHFVYVGDSILGNYVNLGAGVKCANLRLDRAEISLNYQEKRVKTGLKKLGAVIGDRVQVGCNSVLNPGTLLGRESFCYPLMSVSGYVPARSQVTSQGVQPIESKILEKLLWQSTPIVPL